MYNLVKYIVNIVKDFWDILWFSAETIQFIIMVEGTRFKSQCGDGRSWLACAKWSGVACRAIWRRWLCERQTKMVWSCMPGKFELDHCFYIGWLFIKGCAPMSYSMKIGNIFAEIFNTLVPERKRNVTKRKPTILNVSLL